MTRLTEAVLRALERGDQGAPPIDVRHIAQASDVVVVPTTMDDDVSGMLIRDPDSGLTTIGVNKGHSSTRQRFTIAHEIGHLLLHRGREVIVDSPIRVNLRDRTSGMATDREEMEANRFAAELLMPTEMVLDLAAQHPELEEARLRQKLARLFDVSEQAMGYRLINLGVISTPE